MQCRFCGTDAGPDSCEHARCRGEIGRRREAGTCLRCGASPRGRSGVWCDGCHDACIPRYANFPGAAQ